MSGVATWVKRLDRFNGHAALYKLDPPFDGHEFVVVSDVDVMFSGPETYIFPATASGEVTDWIELAGSFRGGRDHARALSGAGYRLAVRGDAP